MDSESFCCSSYHAKLPDNEEKLSTVQVMFTIRHINSYHSAHFFWRYMQYRGTFVPINYFQIFKIRFCMKKLLSKVRRFKAQSGRLLKKITECRLFDNKYYIMPNYSNAGYLNNIENISIRKLYIGIRITFLHNIWFLCKTNLGRFALVGFASFFCKSGANSNTVSIF
jgi:hypothetical protein